MRLLVERYVNEATMDEPIPLWALALLWFYAGTPQSAVPCDLWFEHPGLSLPQARLWLRLREGHLPFETHPKLYDFMRRMGGGQDYSLGFVPPPQAIRTWQFPMVTRRALEAAPRASHTPPWSYDAPLAPVQEEAQGPTASGASPSGLAWLGAEPGTPIAPGPEPDQDKDALDPTAAGLEPDHEAPAPMAVPHQPEVSMESAYDPAKASTVPCAALIGVPILEPPLPMPVLGKPPPIVPMAKSSSWLGPLACSADEGQPQSEGLCSAIPGKTRKQHSASSWQRMPAQTLPMACEASSPSTPEA